MRWKGEEERESGERYLEHRFTVCKTSPPAHEDRGLEPTVLEHGTINVCDPSVVQPHEPSLSELFISYTPVTDWNTCLWRSYVKVITPTMWLVLGIGVLTGNKRNEVIRVRPSPERHLRAQRKGSHQQSRMRALSHPELKWPALPGENRFLVPKRPMNY